MTSVPLPWPGPTTASLTRVRGETLGHAPPAVAGAQGLFLATLLILDLF